MTGLPNLVWVTMESTRTDHTSFGDAGRTTTPNLQRIADEDSGRWFSNCFSHGIWTRSSSASILTGTYASRHGAGVHRDTIPPDLPTVAERLGEAGYWTECISPNAHLSSASGLDRGFDEFAWVGKSTLLETVGARSLLRFLLRIRSQGGGLTADTRKHSTNFMLTDLAKRRLRSLHPDSRPFFLYVHLGGPHHPYHPPIPYFKDRIRGRNTTRGEASELALSHHRDLHRHIAEGCRFGPEQLSVLEALYDGEIAHTDRLVGELFDLVNRFESRDTVFVVTGDHGELFGEQGLLSHVISISGAVSRVPLVVHGMDELPVRPDALVQHIDVVRTFLASIGLDSDELQGVDLRDEERPYAIVQRGGDRCRRNLNRIREYNPEFDASVFPESTVTALRTDEYAYRTWEDGSALYALPNEITDVSERFPEVAAGFAAELEGWLGTDGRPLTEERDRAEMPGEMRAQLRDLGYIVD